MYQNISYWVKKWRRRILLALAIIGPGIITAVADNDAAGISTFSVAASTFGYQMFIILLPMMIVLAVTQEIGARIAIVTEEGLGDLIREHYGVRMAILIYLLLFVVNLIVVIMDVAGLKAALSLFHLNTTLFLPAIIAALFLFVVLSNYTIIERFFFVLVAFYITYVASAFLAKPDWVNAVTSLVILRGQVSPHFLYVAIALIGTTVTAWGQFFIHSYVRDKHLTLEHLKYTRLEVYFGAFVTVVLTFFAMVAVAATLYTHNIHVEDAAVAALAIQPFAGQFATLLFGVGLLFAGILGCVIVALSTAYVFSEFFGYSGSLDENFSKSKLFYTTLLVQLGIATGVAMIPQISLFAITLAGNFISGAMLPIIFYFLYKFANNEAIMGTHTNNKFQNWLLVGSAVAIIFASSLGLLGQILGW